MNKKDITKEYTSEKITVIWKPGVCIHAAVCVNKLPDVYKPGKKPWIAIENASANELIEQIDACPSGALSYKINDNTKRTKSKTKAMEKSKVAGTTPLVVDLESGKAYAWCACGHSSKQPWCDGSHKATEIKPQVFKSSENRKAAMCMCKQSGNKPYCDGTHANL